MMASLIISYEKYHKDTKEVSPEHKSKEKD